MNTKKKYKLPKKFAKKWLKALRSGEYEQGRIELYNKNLNKYCCLGVACIICGAKKEWLSREILINENGMLHRKLGEKIPKELIRYNNFNNDFTDILVRLNDGNMFKNKIDKENFINHGIEFLKEVEIYNFNEISDFIELNTEFY